MEQFRSKETLAVALLALLAGCSSRVPAGDSGTAQGRWDEVGGLPVHATDGSVLVVGGRGLKADEHVASSARLWPPGLQQ